MIILGTNSIKDTGYDVANSLRFNSGSSDNLSRTQSTGNQRTYTVSFWIKRSSQGGQEYIVSARYGNQTRYQYIRWNGDNDANRDKLDIFSGLYSTSSTSTSMAFLTNRKFRDVSAWYHIVLAVDTTQGTESNRVKIYVNGVQETSFTTATYPSQNQQHFFNINTTPNEIGVQSGGSYLNSYLSEVVLVDGQQLDATSFGEFDSDSGIWKPIDVSGLTFGTNGFYLDFEDSSALGNDAAGSNNFTVNNLTAIDQSTDTCTNNFATLNPLASSIDTTNNVLKEGNLQVDHGDGNYDGGTATFGFLDNMSGKWYWEVRNNASTGSSNQGEFAGIAYIGSASSTVYDDFGTESYLLATTGSNIIYKKDNSAIWTLTSPSGFSAGDIINVALDLDNNKIWFGLNGTFYDMSDGSTDGDPTGSNGATVSRDFDYLPYYRIVGNTAQLDFNFGSPAFAISSGNTDGNGYGNFEYAVPSGYYALNTKNLAEYG
jgi:hypothetical protein